MIAIIDYEMGNLRSVENALSRLGAEWKLTSDPEEIRSASRVLLPGVGNDAEAMGRLRERGLCEVIRNLRHPVLGICVGMQVMCRHSEEGDVDCLGIFDAHIRRFPEEEGLKVPHVAGTESTIWNRNCSKISAGEAMSTMCIHIMPISVLTPSRPPAMAPLFSARRSNMKISMALSSIPKKAVMSASRFSPIS